MATNPIWMRQASLSKRLGQKTTGGGIAVSGWRRRYTRLRQEPLAVVLLVWGALFLLAWLCFSWLD
jgi:hypothetical protein